MPVHASRLPPCPPFTPHPTPPLLQATSTSRRRTTMTGTGTAAGSTATAASRAACAWEGAWEAACQCECDSGRGSACGHGLRRLRGDSTGDSGASHVQGRPQLSRALSLQAVQSSSCWLPSPFLIAHLPLAVVCSPPSPALLPSHSRCAGTFLRCCSPAEWAAGCQEAWEEGCHAVRPQVLAAAGAEDEGSATSVHAAFCAERRGARQPLRGSLESSSSVRRLSGVASRQTPERHGLSLTRGSESMGSAGRLREVWLTAHC